MRLTCTLVALALAAGWGTAAAAGAVRRLPAHAPSRPTGTASPSVVSVTVQVNSPPTPPPAAYPWMLGQNAPNPLASPTTIQFSCARAAPVSIRVFDLAGRVVLELVNGPYDAGRYTVTWDGRDRRGRWLPPGIYVYRMSTPWFVQAKKLVVVR